MKSVVLIFTTWLLFSCSAEQSYQAEMPSGLIIEVHKISKKEIINGKNSLVLEYESNVDIENDELLENELEQVWEGFKKKADKENLVSAIVLPTNTTNRTTNFRQGNVRWYYYRKTDGVWESGQ